MNLDEIRKRMDRLQNKSNGKSSSDFKKNFWKPPSGEKSVVRIVPYKYNKDVPFTELYFYFGIDKTLTHVLGALANYSLKCVF